MVETLEREPLALATGADSFAPLHDPVAETRSGVQALLLAGDGRHSRSVQGRSKPFVEIAGRPMFLHVLETLLRTPEVSEIFVVGDLALAIDAGSGKQVPGVAQGAMQTGHFAGRTIASEIEARAEGRPAPARAAFVYDDKGTLATIGRNRAVGEIRGFKIGGWVAFGIWAFIHILPLINFPKRLATLAEWTWMYFFYERGVRLITGEERVPKPVKIPPDARLG